MRMISSEQRIYLMRILMKMNYTKEEVFQICHRVEIPEVMLKLLDVLEQRNFEIPFKELLPIAQRIEEEVIEAMPDEG